MNVGGRIRDFFLSGEGAANVVVALVFFLLAILLVVTVIYLLYARSPRGRLAALTQQRATATRSGRWLLQVLAVGLFVAMIFGANAVIERPETCAQCHTDEALFASAEASSHGDEECASCHRPDGPLWPVEQIADFARWTYVNAASDEPPAPDPGSVDGEKCLDCHDDIREGVRQRGGIRVRHSDFVGRMYGCRDCHSEVGHPGEVQLPTAPTMDKCMPCHDGTTAPTECDTCHAEDVGTPSEPDPNLPSVAMPAAAQYDSCYGCHEEATCTSCHGIRMPHPEDWKDIHMRDGFTRREDCFRCHSKEGQPFVASDEGCSCHGLLGDMHSGELWVPEHGPQAVGERPGRNAECALCHGEPSHFCGLCHPPEYAQRYNPVAGEDSYRPPTAMPSECAKSQCHGGELR